MHRSTEALFDLIVIVDWSAASRPTTGADSIWWSAHDRAAGTTSPPVNPSTRRRVGEQLLELLDALPDRRVLVGFDFAFGHPRGFAAAADLGVAPSWRAMWEHLSDRLHDDADNRNDRFAVASELNARVSPRVGPFWGTTSATQVTPHLSRTKAPGFPHRCAAGPLAEHRLTERYITGVGARRPASVWQLAGIGSVGSQTLTGIPVVGALRAHARLAERALVWPFETGLVADPTTAHPAAIVFAEVWPSCVVVDRSRHAVKDAAQVVSLAEHLGKLDAEGGLGPWFAPSLAAPDAAAVVDEEGWILGARPGDAVSSALMPR